MTSPPIVNLHLSANGDVWYAEGIQVPQKAETLEELVDAVLRRGRTTLRLLGTSSAASLISELYTAYPEVSLELASPAICTSQRERENPTIAIHRMRQCLFAPSLGGWHRVTRAEWASYAIAKELQDYPEGRSSNLILLMEQHPAYYDLGFIPSLDMLRVAEVIAAIRDPRWYIDVRNPSRMSRIRSYMGLSPKVVEQAYTQSGRDAAASRLVSVFRSWNANWPTPIDRGEDFLQSRYRYLVGYKGASDAVATLRVSQMFLTYLVRTWQQQLVQGRGQAVELFVPEDLLRSEDAGRYREYVRKRPTYIN